MLNARIHEHGRFTIQTFADISSPHIPHFMFGYLVTDATGQIVERTGWFQTAAIAMMNARIRYRWLTHGYRTITPDDPIIAGQQTQPYPRPNV